ncbi:DUF1800 family protein [Pelagicoccus sp. SDUM812002]|uniref:DUF1800 family protein n=1 Tax=Pelagicoccus sp. SDUM812002 TaxID=3041266 RepID=UPI00280EB819|nr:DUF1800 family protein [Pelagicoccus sp. SDUM812002]MDQ8187298.1 DUF1800 family protein [Pelagicoccus sp. SDUM812002]
MRVLQLCCRQLLHTIIASLLIGYTTLSAFGQENGVTREVWTSLEGSGIENLIASPNYPQAPTIRDLLPTFSTPVNFASTYGTRLRSYLTPSVSGEYSFWIQGDDNCVLYFGSDGTPNSATLIASVPSYTSSSEWDKYPEQHSLKITLNAGQTYYLEVLHKEGTGGDFVNLAWDLAGNFTRQEIPTERLTPYESAPAYDPDINLYVEAGAAQSVYLPASSFQPSASVLSKSAPLETLAISWSQTSGSEAIISDSDTLTPTIVAHTPGVRTFTLSVSDGTETRTDTVAVSVFEPLAEGTGSFTQEIWLDVDSSQVEGLLDKADYPSRPHLIRTTEDLTGPRNWGDRYGTRTHGLITPPTTGTYTFYVTGDDDAALFLSSDDSPSNKSLIAFTPENTAEGAWTQFPEQISDPILLEKGETYYLELLFSTRYGNDFHAAAWSVEGGPISTIGGEFFISAIAENNAPSFESASAFVVEAGTNRSVHSPDSSVTLQGKTLKILESYTVESITWSQVSGPALASLSNASELTTIATLPHEGSYKFNLTIRANGIEGSDTVEINVLPAINDQTGGFTREVWLGIKGESVEDLKLHSDFPNTPHLVDQLPSLAGPENWNYNYGSRATGFLIPTRSGPHTFYITADDSAVLSLSNDSSPAGLREIATSGRRSRGDFRDSGQISEAIDLIAGNRYFVEVLHKQYYGNDHFEVSWSFGNENSPTPIGGGNLEPSDSTAIPLDIDLPEYAFAGPDRHYYAPTRSFDLTGKILEVGAEDNFHKVEWFYLGENSAVSIESPNKLNTTAKVPSEGTYRFRLTLKTSGKTHYDDVSIHVLPQLNEDTGGVNRAVWLNVEGSTIESLLLQDPLLRSPAFDDIIPSLETPLDWTDNYGTHIIGYIHPPATGDYQFWLAANDAAELYLSPNENPEDSILVASTTNAVSSRNWDRYESQASAPVTLEAGKKYLIEVLHKEGGSSDNLAVAWGGPGLNQREVISAGYLSPIYPAQMSAEEILVLAGEDQSIRWPLASVELFARVYDQKDGPETLDYQWSSSDERVAFSTPSDVSSQASFPEPGNYTISLTASDGENFATDSLSVTVAPAYFDNIGSITREVWLDLPGSQLDDLISDERFPDSPDIVDTIDVFDLPRHWADYYGTRVRGFLIAPNTGDYQFYVSADDYARVSINTNSQSFDGLKQIINSQGYSDYLRWDRREDQASAPIRLNAGQAYPIELLHREKNGGDHAALAWKRPGSDEIEVITGRYLSPANEAEPASKNLIVVAPIDIIQRWPQNIIDLHGLAIDRAYGPESLKTRWQQTSGPGVLTFSSTIDLETNVHVSEPGEYTLRLYASDGSEEIYDEMNITIDAALSSRAGAATRSTFTDIAGDRVVHLVTNEKFPQAPDSQGPIPQLDTETNSDGDNYGTLVTGYIHPPVSGTYRFSVSGDDWVELWLSPDNTAGHKALVCFTPAATGQYEWDKYPEYQTSTEIELDAGQKYYLEIRHKENSWRDHFAVAWLQPDADEMKIIQGAYLSPLDDDAVIDSPEIVILGNDTTTISVGATFNDPGFYAVNGSGQNINDQVVVTNHVNTEIAGIYSVRYQVVNPSTGFAETVVRTVEVVPAVSHPAIYPDPSCRPPLMVEWEEPVPGQISAEDASRFLAQATFGPTKQDIARVQEIGYEAWIDEQFYIEPSYHRDQMLALRPALDDLEFRPYADERLVTWWTTAISAPDQLRQRVAFALSEIVVLSDKNSFNRLGLATANFYDILVRNGFGSYEQILQEVTVNPLMGEYLTLLRSDKSSPDENYAREIMQLFSIGLIMLNPDGTPLCDVDGHSIPTYDNDLIIELARAFTGWTYAGSDNFNYTPYGETDFFSPMVPFDDHHDFGKKTLTGGFTLPQGLSPTEDLRRAVKHFADHPNAGPFVGYRLIQRLTTSNPSPGYIYRVAKTFDDDGNGGRGNLAAVVKAILLDPEARDPDTHGRNRFGKLREPILRLTHLLRSFEAETSSNPPVFGRYPIHNTTEAFAQSPMQAPSVFNFFSPEYAPPGEIMNRGLVAPEFATTTEITTVDTANFLHETIGSDVPLWWRYSTSIRPNLSALSSIASDSNAILDELNVLLMSGSLTAKTRAIVKATIDNIDEPEERVVTALKLLISSPEFSIQK